MERLGGNGEQRDYRVLLFMYWHMSEAKRGLKKKENETTYSSLSLTKFWINLCKGACRRMSISVSKVSEESNSGGVEFFNKGKIEEHIERRSESRGIETESKVSGCGAE